MVLEHRYVYIHGRHRSREYRLLSSVTRQGAAHLRAPGRTYAVALDGNAGRPRGFDEAIVRARELLRSKPIGVTVQIRAYVNDRVVDSIRFRAITTRPPVKDTEGVEGIDRFVGWIEAQRREGRLKSRRYAGICVCKPDSDHRDCAAVDVFGTNKDMETMRDEALREADYFRTKYVILFDRIYFPTADGKFRTENYTGDYHYHVHVSVYGGIPGSAC